MTQQCAEKWDTIDVTVLFFCVIMMEEIKLSTNMDK